MTTAPWKIEYNNDTGPGDDSFYEWWEVSNGDMTFKSDNEDHAEWLLALLKSHSVHGGRLQ